MTLTFGGGISIGPGITITLPITATAGATTSVSVIQNTAIASFNPFASVINGAQPYTYFVSSGTLPTGITINSSTGVVSGTPTVAYPVANVTFSVKDSSEVIAETTSTVAFTVNAPLSAVAGATTTVSGYQNSAITNFNPFSSVTGGFTPYVYSVSSGTLPAGITLNSSTGQVSGTPNATYTTANVVFRVTDAQGTQASTTATVSFTVNAPISATAGATSTVSATQNSAITSFNPFSSVTGGFTPYTYFVSAGTLPTGITINPSTGLVSGTPTVVQGAANVTFSVRDVNNVTAATTSTVSFAVLVGPYTIQYLVVAGGGGGWYGGGGGGGFLSGNTALTSGTTYPITVGQAGSGGSNGTDSIAFSITAIGGGYGGVQFCGPTPGFGNPGGSGGGGWVTFPRVNPAGRAGGSGTPGQGNSGGSGARNNNGTAASGGGGGGAGSPGTAGCAPAPGGGSSSGSGGTGLSWTFTGPTIFYSRGGGGKNAGCGANGGTPPSCYGGGAAGTGAATTGQNGVIRLAVPTPNYPGSAPGATVTTPPAAPGMTVLTYTSPGSYTA